MAENCPSLEDYLLENSCEENIAGTSSIAYVFDKSDLASPITRNGNVYDTPSFKPGKGLYKFELKDDSQQIQGESQGPNAGFNLTYNMALKRVSKKTSEAARTLNNLNIGIIVVDHDDSQIMYDQNRRLTAESGGIKSDTGAAPGDDRQTTFEYKLPGQIYPNFFVKEPEAGWDSLLASKAAV